MNKVLLQRVASKCKMRINGRRLSSTEGSMVEILELLRQRGPSRFPQVRLSIHAPCSCHAPVCYALVLGQNQIARIRHQATHLLSPGVIVEMTYMVDLLWLLNL